ncbi:MAG: TAT-variant-translocated molybdopterin oxidoreductase [Ignavibacteriales bacterium]|nr:TAT-variant-translocated molybdopterin oxidoreductase [Ignavibacteriales bacterium]
MSDSSKSSDKKQLWKSLNDYNNDPEVLKFKHDEFVEGVTEEFDPSKLSGISRRKFLALLSASAALTATACTNYRDKGEIIPYNKRPEEVMPGVANYYASTCNGCGQACGILIKTREGRPIKIDGNPDHPINKGKICAKGQASILDLYDPERLKAPRFNRNDISWKSVDNDVMNALNSSQSSGNEIAVVTGSITSPTTKKVLNDFVAKYSNTKIYSYSLINDQQRRNAWMDSYGTDEYPAIKWKDANVILALDADFLGNEGSYIENMREYTQRRETNGKTDFNRLYVGEGRMSVTGMLSDYRFRLSPDSQYEFVMALINELSGRGSSIAIDSNAKSKFGKYSLAKFEALIGKDKLDHLVNDLNANRGKSIIYAGDTLPKEVHVAVNLLNEILGNTVLYDYTSLLKSLINQSTKEEISKLIDSMNDGKVGAVIHFDSNPVFTLPGDYGYTSALKKVNTVVTLTEAENETSAASNYILPINHAFESWGDANTRSNVYSLQQPVISPIFNTRQKEAVLLTWISGDANSYKEDSYHQYLMNNFNATVYTKQNTFADAKTFWYSALHDGVVLLNEPSQQNKFNLTAFNNIKELENGNGFTLHLTESYFVGDGKFANNGWLQETPHPVTKVTWDNYAAISPKLAKQLDVEMNDLVSIGVGKTNLELPVLVQPGMDNKTINIELGYGRTVVGEVGKEVGFNSISLMSKEFSLSPYIYQNVIIKKVNETHKLVSTQEHHSLDDTFVKDFHRTRKIIQEGTVEKYKKEPNFLHEVEEKLIGITREHQYTDLKWAMAIDLNKCTSCSACVTSCNVENNIPVVGKDQVGRGREMQWIRIDRYYSGTPDEPIVSNQPMLCQHCDNAPCENVCPVNATNHSPDGLNQMVYNRCVGTRYCSNNCPYKVRRYNFFNHRDHFADAYYDNDLTSLVHNPEVTVRSRGVMEKCTFCVQRIMEARSNATRDGKIIKGSDVVTACQQACPTNAITFGDTNDPNSDVAKLREHNLSYHVLEELYIKPNVTYIAKLRNTHSEEI